MARGDRDFDAAIKDAARSLAGFSNVIKTLTGGGPGVLASAQSGGVGGLALGAAGAAVGGAFALAQGAAQFFTPAANAYAITGSSAAFAGSVTNSLVSAARETTIGGFILGATGVSAAQDVNRSAIERVSGITSQLARFGVQVSDDERERLFGVAQAQERRAQLENEKVAALAGGAEALRDSKPAGAGAGFDLVVGVLERIENLLKSGTGGHN